MKLADRILLVYKTGINGRMKKKAYNRIARTDEMCLLMWQIICIYVYAERRRRRSRRRR